MGPLGKACKKCVSDQKHNKDGNSPVVPTLIRDGRVGSGSNHCQIDTDCQRWQGWDHLARPCKKCFTDQNQNNVKKLSGVSEWPPIVGNNPG